MTKSNLKKKGFILSYGSREMESIMAGKIQQQSRKAWWMAGAGNGSHFHLLRESKEKTGYVASIHTPKAHSNHVLPLTKLHLCKQHHQLGPSVQKHEPTVMPSLLWPLIPDWQLVASVICFCTSHGQSPHLLGDTSQVQSLLRHSLRGPPVLFSPFELLIH